MLLEAAGENWTRIYLKHSGTSRVSTQDFWVTPRDGEAYRGRFPSGGTDPINELRAQMYREGTGTWFSMTYVITPPGSFSVDYDYDSKPDFPFELDPITYYNDLRRFSRSSENIPGWLQEAMAKAEEIIAQGERE